MVSLPEDIAKVVHTDPPVIVIVTMPSLDIEAVPLTSEVSGGWALSVIVPVKDPSDRKVKTPESEKLLLPGSEDLMPMPLIFHIPVRSAKL